MLTVRGMISHRNAGTEAVFDRANLEALGLATIRTSTPWTDGVVEFEGVPLKAVLAAVGGKGKELVATALNDYKANLPMSDAEQYRVLLALRMNGRDLSLRDRGPLWIVYPRDAHAELRSNSFNVRWVWALSTLEVR
ncbi:molybdopterin-dependent oxidoreductase [Arenibaculum pallidiluteum]|uniref:molybdopterin-dependent oxidoreductase n=1 Tax=Arenibaculum pallidiluteum TaxID=2812559 RepID=UPI001A975B25|nr:molybdopterin-dependent oxidoreductase [Arenibaculum pallidiluteum]